jgi:hypothetical protein
MPSSFSDITTHWAKACILELANRHLVSGYPDGTFRPDGTITRAEFAALTYVVFPDAQPIRSPIRFPDVPETHWANQAIQWAYQRGFFSGYPDGTFQPNQPIPRVQAISVLVTALRFSLPASPDSLLALYFNDVTEIGAWAKGAIAAAILSNLIVNYPNVRDLHPNQNATRGEVSALLCRGLKIPNTVPPEYATWTVRLIDITGSVTVPYAMWKGSAQLILDIQTRLTAFQLYSYALNGDYNWYTEQALIEFCNFYGLPNMKTGIFDAQFAWTMLHANPVDYSLALAKDRQQVFNDYFQQEAGYNADKLAFLDRGIQASPYQNDVAQYPDRLLQKPDGKAIVSLGDKVVLTGTTTTVTFSPYPNRGQLPQIDSAALNFLHPDIQQACIAMGSIVNGAMWTHWLGRNALSNVQLWSTTKFIPMLNLVSQANAIAPTARVRDCLVRPQGSADGYGFYNMAVDLVTYQSSIASSNAIAATFKQFSTPASLEGWVKDITGNTRLEFQGRYGEPPLIERPDLYSQPLGKVLLTAPYTSHTGNNALSTYDLARLISMLGWHYHLPSAAQLPYAQWSSLETIVRAMGLDTARYVDVAIAKLGIASIVQSPVIISKLGFGRSSTRDRTELVYVALVQFIDQRPQSQGKPAILRTLSMALLAAKALNDANREATELDARMAAEVTEILRRVVMQELA